MDSKTLDALDRNYRLASAETFACSDVGEALEARHVHIVTCGFPVAEFNWAFLKFPGRETEQAAERAERYFDERKLPFRFIVRGDLTDSCEKVLEARGHARVEKTTPGMALASLAEIPAPPAELEIRTVDDARTLAAFSHTAFAGFGIPTAFGEKFLTEDLLMSPASALRIGYVGDVPVATALQIATGHVSGVYWVATLEDHRRKGYGEALTFAVLKAGRELGCTIGSLQASEMGKPVYARMGFEHTCDYVFYERPTA